MFRNPYADGLIILVIVLLFFGPKRLPSLARSLGESAKEFKNSIGSHSSDEEERPEITQAAAPAAPAATPAEPPAAAASTPASSPADSAS